MSIRNTATGRVLLALVKCRVRVKLQEAIKKVVDRRVINIRAILLKIRVELVVFHSLKSEGEILEALKEGFPDLSGELKITLFAPNHR